MPFFFDAVTSLHASATPAPLYVDLRLTLPSPRRVKFVLGRCGLIEADLAFLRASERADDVPREEEIGSGPGLGGVPTCRQMPRVDLVEMLAAGGDAHWRFVEAREAAAFVFVAVGGDQLVAHLDDLVERERRGGQRVEHRRLVDVIAPAFHRGADEQLVLADVRLHVRRRAAAEARRPS